MDKRSQAGEGEEGWGRGGERHLVLEAIAGHAAAAATAAPWSQPRAVAEAVPVARARLRAGRAEVEPVADVAAVAGPEAPG